MNSSPSISFNVFKQLFIGKIRAVSTKDDLIALVKQANESLVWIRFPDEEKSGFTFSYADYDKATTDCRKLIGLENAERVEMMVGVRELPYPFTCVVETSMSKMQKLDDEFVQKRSMLNLDSDESGVRSIEQLLGERQSLLRPKTWQTDPPLMGFMDWE